MSVMVFTILAASAQRNEIVSGTVRDPRGAVIQNALVSCRPLQGEVSAHTDVTGQFRLDLSRCEEAILKISAKGFSEKLEKLPADHPASIDVILDPSAIDAVVNVTGIATTVSGSPGSVISVDRTALRNPGAAAIDEGLRQVPGFTLFRRTSSRTANPTSQGVSLRGVGGSGASRAVVLDDGVPLNDPFGGWVYWGRVPFESIEAVEVLRGPGSDLFGSSAIGGVISIRPRQPGDSPFISVEASIGGMKTGALSSYSSFAAARLKGSLAAELFRTEGYIPLEEASRGSVDTPANVDRISLRPRVDLVSGQYSLFVAGEFYQEVRANGTRLQANDTRIKGSRAGFDRGLFRTGSLSGRAFFVTQEYHQSFTSVSNDRNSELISRLQRVPSKAYGANIQGRWSLKGQDMFAGVEFRKVKGTSLETGFASGVPTSRSEAGGDQRSAAAFAGALLTQGRFSVAGSLRYDNVQNSDGHAVTRTLAGTVTSSSQFPDRTESSLNGRASVIYRPSKQVTVNVTYATGFREPTLNELYRGFRLGNVVTLPNESLRAERARNLESSVVFTGLRDRLYLRGGVYCISVSGSISNRTVSVTPTLITRRRDNLDSSRTCGFEADASFYATPSLSFSGNYLFVDSRVSASLGEPALVGLRLPQVARSQFSIQGRYAHPRAGSFSVLVRGAGLQFDDDQNTFPLRRYVTVNGLYSHPMGKHIEFYAAVENLFNSRIEAARTPLLTLGQPRTARVGLRLRFGRGH